MTTARYPLTNLRYSFGPSVEVDGPKCGACGSEDLATIPTAHRGTVSSKCRACGWVPVKTVAAVAPSDAEARFPR